MAGPPIGELPPGPVWHASAASQRLALSESELHAIALDALAGVGDATRGEWYEVGDKAVHVRRRLSEREQRSVGPAVDIRGTLEAQKRAAKVQQYLPSSMRGRVW